VLAVRGQAAQCHGADTGLAAQCCTTAGMASPRELAKQRRGEIPMRVRVVARPCCVRALNARTHVREQVRVGAREMRAWVPSSGADPARGGVQPSSEANFVRGGVKASSGADPARGSVYPSSEVNLTRGASAAPYWRAAGATRVVVMLCMRFRCAS
jgi:hypothetical protein